jgi:hypothetical protein
MVKKVKNRELVRTSNQKRAAFYGAALETFNLCFSRYALQILVSLDSPTIARAAAGLAAFAAAAMFCPKILFMALNILSAVRNCQGLVGNFLFLQI